MTASKLFTIAATIAGASLSLGAIVGGVAAQNSAATTTPTTINNAREVRAAVTACWNVLGDAAPPLAQVSVRVSFDRDGNVFGQPRITYANPPPCPSPRRRPVRPARRQGLCVVMAKHGLAVDRRHFPATSTLSV
jgi:hypothetical protein